MIDVKRSTKPPGSLQLRRSYRERDVLEQLWEDFLGKCYLCESPLQLGSLQVDHRRPRCDGGDEYTWENLFPACPQCNNHRPRKWPEGGLLDPGNSDCVERRLKQYLNDNYEPQFAPADPQDMPALNTADELMGIHDHAHIRFIDLCSAIGRQLNRVLETEKKLLLAKYRSASAAEIAVLVRQLRHLVSRRAPFTALIRCRVPELTEYFD